LNAASPQAKRWRMTFFLSVLAFLAFQGMMVFAHDRLVQVLAAIVSCVYLFSAGFALRKVLGRG
jgi:hypothetical protein